MSLARSAQEAPAPSHQWAPQHGLEEDLSFQSLY